MPKLPNVLILGIGNLLWADEGFGVRALESLLRGKLKHSQDAEL